VGFGVTQPLADDAANRKALYRRVEGALERSNNHAYGEDG